MRETLLRSGEQQITVQTDDYGTRILGPDGKIVSDHGTDRHDEIIAKREAEGWSVLQDGSRRPKEVEGVPAPKTDGPGDGSSELDLGISS